MTDESSKTVRLYADGLLSKWGFEDGDLLVDPVGDWRAVSGAAVDYRDVLVATVKYYLVPELSETLDIAVYGGVHNPIRAESVNGLEINHQDPRLSYPWSVQYVDVTYRQIWDVCNEITGAKK